MVSTFWEKLVDWFQTTLVDEGTISPEDMNLIRVLDEPKDVVDAIFDHYQSRDFEPSAEEREILLEL